MIRKMLRELEQVPELGAEGMTGGSFLDWMAVGWRGKTYKRLLDRQTCGDLISHIWKLGFWICFVMCYQNLIGRMMRRIKVAFARKFFTW